MNNALTKPQATYVAEIKARANAEGWTPCTLLTVRGTSVAIRSLIEMGVVETKPMYNASRDDLAHMVMYRVK